MILGYVANIEDDINETHIRIMAKRIIHFFIPAKMKTIANSILAGRGKKSLKEPILQELTFTGYFNSIDSIPCKDGIYMALARKGTDLPSSYKLLYIGVATGTDCLRNRVGDHINNDHNTQKWLDYYNPKTDEIVYSYALVTKTVRILEIENALIFKARPLVNINTITKVSSDAEYIILYCKGDIGPLKSRYYWDND